MSLFKSGHQDVLEIKEISEKKYKKYCKAKMQDMYDESHRSIRSELIGFFSLLAAAVLIAFLVTHFILFNAYIPSNSMKNTFSANDRLIGLRVSYLFSDPQRGDIVIFKFPDDESTYFVKRIIGIPGDEIRIADGHVYINGDELDEPYLAEPMLTSDTELIYHVPDGCYFMMGDNRNDSRDSRYWEHTYVAKDKIIAKVLFRYYNSETSFLDFTVIR